MVEGTPHPLIHHVLRDTRGESTPLTPRSSRGAGGTQTVPSGSHVGREANGTDKFRISSPNLLPCITQANAVIFIIFSNNFTSSGASVPYSARYPVKLGAKLHEIASILWR